MPCASPATVFRSRRNLPKRINEFSAEFPWVERYYRQPFGTPKPGKIWCKKAWPMCFEKIARQGRDGFYTGEMAEKICATIKAEGGVLAPEDLQPVVASGWSR